MNRRTALQFSAFSLGAPWLTACATKTDLPSSSMDALQLYAASHGWKGGPLNASLLTTIALGFYRDVSFNGLSSDQGDRLLYQWGIYDWGQGKSFEFDISRQFTLSGASGDEAISQLRLTAHYQPTDALMAIKEGNRWCEGKPELQVFEQFIRNSAAFAGVQGLLPVKVVSQWGPV